MLVGLVHYVENSRLEGLQLALLVPALERFCQCLPHSLHGAQVRVHTNTPTCMEAWMGRVGCTLAAITRASIALCSPGVSAGAAVLLLCLMSGVEGVWSSAADV